MVTYLKKSLIAFFVFQMIAVASSMFAADSITLQALRFDEKRDVKFDMLPTRRVGGARMEGKVKIENGQSWIELKFQNLKPAVLFGGDVTCYVVWAVNRDGAAQNLGELTVDSGGGGQTLEFSTGLRNFAVLVTAESYYQVDGPSELVVFSNAPKADPPVMADAVVFNDLGPAPKYGIESVGDVKYDGKKPLELVQAERVFDLAKGLNAEHYAASLYRQAQIALIQATQMYERNRKDGAQRYSRSSVASSNEAIRVTKRQIAFEELEKQIAERQAKMESLESRAKEAEEQLAQTTREREETMASLKDATSQVENLQDQRSQLEGELGNLRRQQEEAAKSMQQMQASIQQMRASMKDLETEKETLQGRLQGALSKVADTRDSARGYIVNLPDILFDVGKATLKPDAQIVLAKLAGILLMMTDLNVRVEGHTDSTGSAEFNLRLSRERASSVANLLSTQGVDASRIQTEGYGMERPVADNSTASGRQKNRRVEIIIAEGEISAQ